MTFDLLVLQTITSSLFFSRTYVKSGVDRVTVNLSLHHKIGSALIAEGNDCVVSVIFPHLSEGKLSKNRTENFHSSLLTATNVKKGQES